jgi:hypothetical protein
MASISIELLDVLRLLLEETAGMVWLSISVVAVHLRLEVQWYRGADFLDHVILSEA